MPIRFTDPRFSSTGDGLVPASGGGTNKFLRADGWIAAAVFGHSVLEFGTDGSAIQTALNTYAGDTIYVPPGTYTCSAQILMPANTTLYLARGAVLLKNYAAASGTAASFISQSSYSSKNSGVTICGEGIIRSQDLTMTGNVIGLYGDNIVLKDFTIDTYANGRAIVASGDDWRVINLRIINPDHGVGVGGIRQVGGNGFIASNCHVESGDDTLQFVPSQSASDPLYNQSISNGMFIGCTGISYSARFLVASSSPVETAITASIKGCSFIDCNGTGSNRVLVIQNGASSGNIQDILVEDCSITVGTGSTSANEAIISSGDSGNSGATLDVTLRNVRIITPTKTPLRIYGTNTKRVRLSEFRADQPSTGPNGLVVDQATDVLVEKSYLLGTSTDHVVLVGGGGAVSRFRMQSGRIEGIYNSFAGVRLANCTNPQVDGVGFSEQSGQTSSLAVSIANTTTNAIISRWDVSGMTNASPLTDSGVTTYRLMCPGMNGGGLLNQPLKVSSIVAYRNRTNLTAASNLVLSPGNYFLVQGNTEIDSADAGSNGQLILLEFQDSPLVKNLNNLTLKGDFQACPAAFLVLIYDGSVWKELHRYAGQSQRFTYTVVGTETDLTELAITLPAARINGLTTYKVSVTAVSTAFSYGMVITGKTTTGFTLSLTYTATAGDTFDFFVADAT